MWRTAGRWPAYAALLVLVSPVAVQAAVLHVDASATGANNGAAWADAFTDLQSALAAARLDPGVTEIWVRAGTYRPATAGGDVAVSFELVPNVGLYGGFAGGETERAQADPAANVTVLSGDLLGDDGPGFVNMGDNSRHVVAGRTTGGVFVLDGFTVSGGASDTHGGGILVQQGTATIANCRVIGNKTAQNGGGLYVFLRGTKVQHCWFENNQAGTRGGGAFLQGRPGNEVTASVFVNNHGLGGGGGLAGSALITDCDFVANRASGGIWADGGGVYSDAATVVNSRFEGNEAEDGDGIYFLSNSTIHGSIFSGNQGQGAGCFVLGRSGLMENCLFAGNGGGGCSLWDFGQVRNCTFALPGGGAHFWGPAKVANCIAWGDGTGPGISVERGAQVAYSTTRKHVPGQGNSTVDPRFAHRESGEWTAAPLYDPASYRVTLTAAGASWTPDALRGLFVRPVLPRAFEFRILANTATTVTIHADRQTVESGASWIGADAFFEITDYRLAADSPCIDAGHNAVAAGQPFDGSVDLDGRPRFADVPERVDVGVGPAPVVDRGAFEFPGARRVLLSHTTAAIAEGGEFALQVRLSEDPGAPVSLEVLTSGDADLVVLPDAGLHFDSTQFDQPQTVRVQARPDADFLNGRLVVRLEWPDGPAAEFVAVEADDEPVPARIYVDRAATGAETGESWADAFRELRDGLQAVQDRGAAADVWIAAGRYLPAVGVFESSFRVGPNMGLYGGFAGGEQALSEADPAVNVVELSGDMYGDDERGKWATTRLDNSGHVVRIDHPDGSLATTVLDGLTIAGGHALDRIIDEEVGGGVHARYGKLDVRRCTFRDNYAEDGGAIGSEGDLRVVDSLFEWNVGELGGGIAHYGGELEVSGCVFRDNYSSWAAGLWAAGNVGVLRDSVFLRNEGDSGVGAMFNCYSAEVANCHFESNLASFGVLTLYTDGALVSDVTLFDNGGEYAAGGALVNYSDGPVTLERIRVIGNRAWQGGGVWSGSDLTIRDSIIAGNVAAEGGAFYAEDPGDFVFVNCTIADNYAEFAPGGGVYALDGHLEFRNCILWGNGDTEGNGEAAQLRNVAGTIAVEHSTVEWWSGELGGDGNDGLDPLLARAAGSAYRLSGCSPAIDAGDNSVVTDPGALDVDGSPRVFGPAVDRGAAEYVYVDADGDQQPDGCACRSDVNGDGHTDLSDLLVVMGNLGRSPATQSEGDVDGDGVVDLSDFGLLMEEFGTSCP